jgi:hypothetical protein
VEAIPTRTWFAGRKMCMPFDGVPLGATPLRLAFQWAVKVSPVISSMWRVYAWAFLGCSSAVKVYMEARLRTRGVDTVLNTPSTYTAIVMRSCQARRVSVGVL